MAIGNYSGIKKVEYSTDGTTWVDLGTPLADSQGVGKEPQAVETGKGTNLYAGVKGEHVFNITDMSKYADLETAMKADTEISVRVTDLEGNVETIAEEASVIVKKVVGSQVGSRNYFEMKVNAYEV